MSETEDNDILELDSETEDGDVEMTLMTDLGEFQRLLRCIGSVKLIRSYQRSCFRDNDT